MRYNSVADSTGLFSAVLSFCITSGWVFAFSSRFSMDATATQKATNNSLQSIERNKDVCETFLSATLPIKTRQKSFVDQQINSSFSAIARQVIRFAVVASQICKITWNSEKIWTYRVAQKSKLYILVMAKLLMSTADWEKQQQYSIAWDQYGHHQ